MTEDNVIFIFFLTDAPSIFTFAFAIACHYLITWKGIKAWVWQ